MPSENQPTDPATGESRTLGISAEALNTWREWDAAKGELAELDARRECVVQKERQAYAQLVQLGREEGWYV